MAAVRDDAVVLLGVIIHANSFRQAPLTDSSLTEVRLATAADLPAIVRLLADDRLGASREELSDPLPQVYRTAFEAMQAQPGNDLLVAVGGGAVVGCLQITIIAGVSRRGATRAQIEGVRVASSARGAGIGERLMRAAIERAQRAGCVLVQLTSDATRVDARRFYERLGFTASHVGMKLVIVPGEADVQ